MTAVARHVRPLTSTVMAASVVLGGCSSASLPSGGMMGDRRGGVHSTPGCMAPTTLSAAVVRVRLSDMGMTRVVGEDAPLAAPMRLRATPAVVAAGSVSLVVENLGWRTHEVVVLPLPEGATEGGLVPGPNGQVDESGSLGEASNSCGPDSGEGITSGSVGWTTIDLEPGRYELICNLTNHYANGMHQELDVR